MYFSAVASKDNATFLLELSIGGGVCKACTKTKSVELLNLFEQSIASILAQ